jgi:arsenite transporter
VLIFAFQADNLLNRPLHIALIAIPILIQVYFNWVQTVWLQVYGSHAASGSWMGFLLRI